MILTSDLSGLSPAVRAALVRKLQHADRARYELGVVEQTKRKRFHDAVVQPGAFNEVGPAQMIMSQDQHQRAMQKYGQLCFMDADFVKWLLKNNEDMRVKQCGTRIQSGWTPNSGKPTAPSPQPSPLRAREKMESVTGIPVSQLPAGASGKMGGVIRG